MQRYKVVFDGEKLSIRENQDMNFLICIYVLILSSSQFLLILLNYKGVKNGTNNHLTSFANVKDKCHKFALTHCKSNQISFVFSNFNHYDG